MGGPRRRPSVGECVALATLVDESDPDPDDITAIADEFRDVLVERVDDRRGSTTPLGYVAFAVRDPDQSVVDAARSYTVARRRTNVFPIVYDCEAETLHRHEIPRLKGRGSTADRQKTPSGCSIFKRSSGEGSPAQIRRPAIRPAPSAAAVAGSSGRRPRRRGRVRPKPLLELLGESGNAGHPAGRRDGAAQCELVGFHVVVRELRKELVGDDVDRLVDVAVDRLPTPRSTVNSWLPPPGCWITSVNGSKSYTSACSSLYSRAVVRSMWTRPWLSSSTAATIRRSTSLPVTEPVENGESCSPRR